VAAAASAAAVVLTASEKVTLPPTHPPTQRHACLALVSPFAAAAPLPVNSTGFFPNVSAGRHSLAALCAREEMLFLS